MSSRRRDRLDGDENALIRDLYPSLRRFAAVVGPSEVEPDDLVQEALMRVVRRGRVGDLDHPNAYLRRTMCNLASDHRRRLGRSRRALARLGPPEPEYQSYPSDVMDLECLSSKARAVLYLREIEGRSFAEIAKAVGGRESSLRLVATRARRRLLSVLSEEASDGSA